MPFPPNLFVILKKLSLEYQLDAYGNFFRTPRFWKKLLFLDNLLDFRIQQFYNRFYKVWSNKK